MIKTWKKHQTIPFLDIARPTEAVPSPEADYARIGKSTIFDLAYNAQTETFDFIEDENPTDVIKNYKPALNQELRTVRGDKAFDAVWEVGYNRPTGDEAMRNVLLVFPAIQGGTTAAPSFFAWLVPVTLIITNFNTVDEKILFGLNFAGNIVKGSATVGSTGQPVFTPFPDQNAWVSTADVVSTDPETP